MKIAIKVHTPELLEKIMAMAEVAGYRKNNHAWNNKDKIGFLDFNLWRKNELIGWMSNRNNSEEGENFYTREEDCLILDAKTDMPQIIEFFKTGTVKETEMEKTTIIDANHRDYSVSRDVHDMFTIKPNGCDNEYRFHEDQIKKLLNVKPQEHILIKRKIFGAGFIYDSMEKYPIQISKCEVEDEHLDDIQKWLDAIKEAKREK